MISPTVSLFLSAGSVFALLHSAMQLFTLALKALLGSYASGWPKSKKTPTELGLTMGTAVLVLCACARFTA